jgi:CubicO group peptidase (beta-lactamase class C family)
MLGVADNPAAIAPAGTVHCSIGDLAKYAAWQVRGARGEGSLLKPETFKKLHTPFRGGGDYALGWKVVSRPWGGGEVLTHGGSNTMFYTVIWLAPKRDFAVVVCTNVGGDGGAKATDTAAARLIQEYLPEPTP